MYYLFFVLYKIFIMFDECEEMEWSWQWILFNFPNTDWDCQSAKDQYLEDSIRES